MEVAEGVEMGEIEQGVGGWGKEWKGLVVVDDVYMIGFGKGFCGRRGVQKAILRMKY